MQKVILNILSKMKLPLMASKVFHKPLGKNHSDLLKLIVHVDILDQLRKRRLSYVKVDHVLFS